MDFQQNVGSLDRVLRGVLGVWLVVVGVAAYLDNRRVTAATAAIAGAGLLQNAATGYCGGNALLGIDTTESCSQE